MKARIPEADTLLVCRSGDVLVVGRKGKRQAIDIVNAFQGEEAKELYERLLTVKKKENLEETPDK